MHRQRGPIFCLDGNMVATAGCYLEQPEPAGGFAGIRNMRLLLLRDFNQDTNWPLLLAGSGCLPVPIRALDLWSCALSRPWVLTNLDPCKLMCSLQLSYEILSIMELTLTYVKIHFTYLSTWQLITLLVLDIPPRPFTRQNLESPWASCFNGRENNVCLRIMVSGAREIAWR